ncbi:hypothetical protein E0765_04725 [Sulfuricurvum sp. IAE1]|uniref:hypothetical protein n=1 Tax=Sulfuricurvum sp. IAE1 TaxID=2546102 RepID=UPI001044F3BB|nr:hypothetical protein [Sulfuricurvum sp. IAE1]TDA65789.1 hypothetical protein E0765_04725 [Sulfuricurvum sp. IAE1]
MEMKFIHKYKSSHMSKRKALKKNINNYKWVKLSSNSTGILVGIVTSMTKEERERFGIPLEIDTSIDTAKFYLNGKIKNRHASMPC